MRSSHSTPDRMAKRILGMGDVISLIEKASAIAEEQVSEEEAKRFAKSEFTFDDFLASMKQIKKMGGLAGLLSSLPGGDKALASGQVDEHELDRIEAIIHSMTAEERRKPNVINGSRRERIAKGAGVQVYDVNQLIKRFTETKKMMKKYSAERVAKGKKHRGRGAKGFGGLNLPDGFGDMFK